MKIDTETWSIAKRGEGGGAHRTQNQVHTIFFKTNVLTHCYYLVNIEKKLAF